MAALVIRVSARDEVIDEKFFLANCILASAFLSIPLAEAAFTTSATAVPGLSTLLFLGGGLAGLVGYRRRKRMM